ncbi:MAG: carbohydrate ABC transporter permease [Lachnospiraceae bacterium]|nr:carbohydrate ABC transporter permease [Lachnospiraceae bacterium]
MSKNTTKEKKAKKIQEEAVQVYHKPLIKRRKPNRSVSGDIALGIFLALVAVIMVFPIVYAVSSALKPLDELFMFPPRIFPRRPTINNFSDLFVTMGKSWVTFSRYLFNTVFITAVGTAGHLFIASMGAFVLAKYQFPGGQAFFKLVTVAMMFTGMVTQIPNYIIINKLGWIDTYWAIIIPAFASPMGLFLMKQFMESLPTALIEAAKIDGASEWTVFTKIVMPNVKPAWMTLIIFSVQGLWNNRASTYIYSEEKKTLVFALQQIQAGGIARTGQAAAVLVVVMIVPILIFVFSESQILETMASSGIKD